MRARSLKATSPGNGTNPQALAFMKKALKRHGRPEAIVTDGLRSYPAAMRELGNADRREMGRWMNNRAENSHLPFRRRERAMLRFRQMKTPAEVRLGPRQPAQPLQPGTPPRRPPDLQDPPLGRAGRVAVARRLKAEDCWDKLCQSETCSDASDGVDGTLWRLIRENPLPGWGRRKSDQHGSTVHQ